MTNRRRPDADPTQKEVRGFDLQYMNRRTRASVCTRRRHDARPRSDSSCGDLTQQHRLSVRDGEIREYDGQRFECVGVYPHTKRDGGATWLAEWNSRCHDCGSLFVFTSPALSKVFQPARRCPDHSSHVPIKTRVPARARAAA